jgi:hypothetical protein
VVVRETPTGILKVVPHVSDILSGSGDDRCHLPVERRNVGGLKKQYGENDPN